MIYSKRVGEIPPQEKLISYQRSILKPNGIRDEKVVEVTNKLEKSTKNVSDYSGYAQFKQKFK